MIREQIKNRLKKGLAANGYGIFVNLGVQLFTVPILLTNWGADLYGEWLILSAIPAYISFSNVGLGDAVATEMTIRVASGDGKTALDLFRGSWRLVTVVSVIAIIILWMLVIQIPITEIFSFAIIQESEVSYLILLLSVHVVLAIQFSLFGGPYRSEGEYPAHVTIVNTIKFLQLLVGMTAVCIGGNPFELAVIFASTYVLGLVYMVVDMRRRIPWIRFFGGVKILGHLKKVAFPSLANIGFTAGNIIINQVTVLIIGGVLGPVSVTVFTVLRTFSRFALKINGMLNNVFMPEMSTAFGQGDKVLFRQLNRKLCQAAAITIVPIFVLMMFFGKELITIWTLGRIQFDLSLFVLILAETLIYLIWYVGSVSITSTNKHIFIIKVYLATNFVACLLTAILVQKMGLAAAPVAFITANLPLGYFVIREMMRVTNDHVRTFLISIFRRQV